MRVSMAVQRQTFSTCINRNPNIFYKRYPKLLPDQHLQKRFE